MTTTAMNRDQARFNMIEQQIRPWNVLDTEVLQHLALLRRDDFAPAEHRDLAFADVEIPLLPDARPGQGRAAPGAGCAGRAGPGPNAAARVARRADPPAGAPAG